MSPTKVLIVEDEPDLASLLQDWLEEEGYEVHVANEGSEALRSLYQHRPSMTITDLRMPGMDGFQLISRIREMSDAHIMVLSGMGNEEHILRGLELGADEYLVKPVTRRVFLARVGSILRRAVPPEEVTQGYADTTLTLDFRTHEVHVRGQARHLRPVEFRLLACLAQNCDRVVSQDEILHSVWGDVGGSLDSLKWHISSLREKIEEDPHSPSLIVTVPRVGYRYLPPDPS